MDARREILARVGPGRDVEPPGGLARAVRGGFQERFLELGGRIVDDAALRAFPGRKWCVEPGLALPGSWGPHEPAGPWEADLGVTGCACLVEEVGAVGLAHRRGAARLASLLPPVHLVLASRDQLVPSLDEAIALLGGGPAVLVCGPSRSADIEGVMVRGVHGPRELWLAWV